MFRWNAIETRVTDSTRLATGNVCMGPPIAWLNSAHFYLSTGCCASAATAITIINDDGRNVHLSVELKYALCEIVSSTFIHKCPSGRAVEIESKYIDRVRTRLSSVREMQAAESRRPSPHKSEIKGANRLMWRVYIPTHTICLMENVNEALPRRSNRVQSTARLIVPSDGR